MPAVVSGPGGYSQRSDAQGQPIRSLPDPDYGEAQAYRETQKAAPLANSAQSAPNAPYPSDIARSVGSSPTPVVQERQTLPGLFDPTERPDEPVTTGAPIGPGANSIAGMPGDFTPATLRDSIMQYAVADPTGMLGNLANSLAERGWL